MLSLPLSHGRRWLSVAAEFDQNEALRKEKKCELKEEKVATVRLNFAKIKAC